MTDNFGNLASRPNGRSVRFERHLDATADEVWAATTQPEPFARWLLAEASIEPRVGGAVTLRWETPTRPRASCRSSQYQERVAAL